MKTPFNDYKDPEAVTKRRLGCALVHTMCSPRRVLVLVERRSCNKILFNDYIGPRGVSKRSLGCALVHAMCSPRRVLVLVVRQRNGDPGPRILHHQGIDHKLIYNDQQWGVRALPRGPNHGGDHTGGQKLHFSNTPAKRNRHFRTAAGVGKMDSRGGPAFKIRRKRGGRPGRQGPF